jgi:hypothetical protein
MRFKYSNGTSSDDCGHTDDDPQCVANMGTVASGPDDTRVATSSADFQADADDQRTR